MLIDAIISHDADTTSQDDSVAFDLARLLTGKSSELAGVRADLVKLALSARQPTIRQLGFVALIAADRGTDRAWALATRSTQALLDLYTIIQTSEIWPRKDAAGGQFPRFQQQVKILINVIRP